MSALEQRKQKGRKGLCLPEILVSCLIALVAIGAILSTFLSGRMASHSAKNYTQARNLARQRMEQLQSLYYSELTNMTGSTLESDLVLDDRGGGLGTQCTRVTTITQAGSGISLAVTIIWNQKTAGSGFTPWSYDLRTWVAYPGIPSGLQIQ
jgi:Tfp pilus assembly protein PilV